MKIAEWGKNDRPRERLEKNGAEALSDAELIAILLRTGYGRGSGDGKMKSAVDLARELLSGAGNSLGELSRLSLERMESLQGMGKVKAITVKAAFELGRRFVSQGGDTEKGIAITDSKKAFELLYPHLKSLDHEECWVIFLNRGNRVISVDRISKGGCSSTVVDRKMILKTALEKLAGGLILAHNHPSGNRFPGESDIKETKALKEAARLMDISLLDHIIVAGEGYYSIADNE